MLGDGALQFGARGMGRGPLQQFAELLDELAQVGRELAVGEARAVRTEGAGALKSASSPGAKPVSPASIAYCASRIRCARQNWQAAPGEAFLPGP